MLVILQSRYCAANSVSELMHTGGNPIGACLTLQQFAGTQNSHQGRDEYMQQGGGDAADVAPEDAEAEEVCIQAGS